MKQASKRKTNPTDFYSQKSQRLTFLALEHWTGGLGVGLELLAPEISLWIFIHHRWVWDQTIPCLHSTYQSPHGFSFYSVVVELPFSSIPHSSEWLLFHSLVAILMRSGKEVSHVCLCHHLGHRSLLTLQLFLQFSYKPLFPKFNFNTYYIMYMLVFLTLYTYIIYK